MATITKVTKESAPKAAKATSPVPAPENKGVAKAEKAVAPPKRPMLVEDSKSTKNASKTSPQPQIVIPEPEQATDPKPAEKAAQDTLPKVMAAVAQADTQAPAAVIQDQKWQEIRLILEKLKEDT